MMSLPQPQRLDLTADGDLSALKWTGEREAVCLLLHGLGDSAWIWQPVIEAWPGPRPTFLAPDLPGHGSSAAVGLKEAKSAAVAARLAPHLSDLETPWVVGHSAGAKVALGLVATGLLDASGISLVDAADAPGPAARGAVMAHVAMLRRGAPGLPDLVATARASDPLADPALLSAYFQAAGCPGGAGWHVPIGRGAEALMSGDIVLQQRLPDVRVPVQVIRGAFSSICTAAQVEALVRVAHEPRAPATIDKAGHAIMMNQPAALARAIADALV
ncbi:MAG: alpha/beta hydrolase [Pseudomonadota bacterium]